MKRLPLLLVPMLIALAFGASVARAVEVDDDGVIAAGEVVHDDVILTGERVQLAGRVEGAAVINADEVLIAGVVEGDVFILANKTTISGEIEGNLIFGGQQLSLQGRVGDSVFFGGGGLALQSQADIGRNLYFAGYSLLAEAGSTIHRDASLYAYQAGLDGAIGRNVEGELSAFELGGKVAGDVQITVEAPGLGAPPYIIFSPGLPGPLASGLRVASGAEIGGVLTYTSPADQFDNIQGIDARRVVYEPLRSEAEAQQLLSFPQRAANWLADLAVSAASLLILGGLAVGFIPQYFGRAVKVLGTSHLTTLVGLAVMVGGYGGAFVLSFIILTAATVLVFFNLYGLAGSLLILGGSLVLFAIGLMTVLVVFASKLAVAGLIGVWVLRERRTGGKQLTFGALALGLAIYLLARTLPDFLGIPFVGWLIGAAATTAGMGALWLARQPRA